MITGCLKTKCVVLLFDMCALSFLWFVSFCRPSFFQPFFTPIFRSFPFHFRVRGLDFWPQKCRYVRNVGKASVMLEDHFDI